MRNVNVQRNDQVKAGDLLADLEIGDLENQLAEAQLKLKEAERTSNNALADAEADLEKARLQLQKKSAEDVKADVVAKEIALQNAQDQRKFAYDEYDKAKNRPWDDDDVTEQYHKNFVEADRNLTVAQAEYEQALASQKTYAYDIALLKQDVTQAERKVNQIKAEGGTPLDVEQAKLEVKKIADKIAAATVNCAVRWQSAVAQYPPGQFGGGVQDGGRGGRSESVGTHRRIGGQRCGRTQRRDAGQSCACAIGRVKTFKRSCASCPSSAARIPARRATPINRYTWR